MPNEERTDVVLTDEVTSNIWNSTSAQPIPQPAPQANPPEPKVEEPKPDAKPTEPQPTPQGKQPEFNINNYLKENFGFDSPEVAKEHIEKWRKSESEPKPEPQPQKPTFANEESEKLYNSIIAGDKKKTTAILKKQEEIENAANLQPLDAIKLNLKLKNEHYTNDDVNDILEEKYVVPKKPNKNEFDTDEDFDAAMQQYESAAQKVQRRIERDSKDAIKELQNLKQDLVLPNINNDATNYQAYLKQQEDLQKQEDAIRNNYKQALEKEKGNFQDFTTVYKDKDVEIPITYKPTEQEVKDLDKKFATDFDADEYLAKRWFKMDGDKVVGHNIQQQKQDVYLLENRQKIFDKIASESYNQAIDNFLKREKNINFKSDNQMTDDIVLNKQQELDKQLTESLWGKKQ